jgi:hypothetical protein
MLIRNAFITNSSSTAFIAYGCLTDEAGVNHDKGLLHNLDAEDGIEFIWDSDTGDCAIYSEESSEIARPGDDRNLWYTGFGTINIPPNASELWDERIKNFCRKHDIEMKTPCSWIYVHYAS